MVAPAVTLQTSESTAPPIIFDDTDVKYADIHVVGWPADRLRGFPAKWMMVWQPVGTALAVEVDPPIVERTNSYEDIDPIGEGEEFDRTGKSVALNWFLNDIANARREVADVPTIDAVGQLLQETPSSADLPLLTIESRFTKRNRGQVMGYLDRYSWLPGFLASAVRILDRYFPQGTEYNLELFSDPEEDWIELFVNIRCALPISEALERLDAFDDDWFLDQVGKVGGIVSFNVE